MIQTKDGSGTNTYSYDQNGNRVSKADGTGKVTTYTYNLANQLIKMVDPSGAITNYSYDKNGNLLTETVGTNVTSYGYNFDGKLVKITDPDGKTTAFVYDGEGRRISKTYDGVVTKYYFDGMTVAKEMNAAGMVLATYLYGLGGTPVTMSRNGQNYYYLFNGHGDTIALANSAGALVTSYGYDAFGKAIETTGTVQNPFQYVGKYGYYYDGETGLHFIQIRYYDSEKGRFTSADTFSGMLTNPITQNAYVYGNSDPVNHVDLDGHFPLWGFIDKYIVQPVKQYIVDPFMTYVVESFMTYVVEPFKKNVIDPVINFGKSVVSNVQQGAGYINDRYIQPAKKAVETEAEKLQKRVVKAKEEVKNMVKNSIDKAINDARVKAEEAKKEALAKLNSLENSVNKFFNTKEGQVVRDLGKIVGGGLEMANAIMNPTMNLLTQGKLLQDGYNNFSEGMNSKTGKVVAATGKVIGGAAEMIAGTGLAVVGALGFIESI